MPSDSSSDSSGCCGLLSTKLFMTDIRPPFPLRKVGLRFPGLLRLFMGGSLLRGILSEEVTDGGEGVYERGGCFVIAMFEEVDGEEQLGKGREDCDGGGRPLLLVPPIRLWRSNCGKLGGPRPSGPMLSFSSSLRLMQAALGFRLRSV